MNADEPTDLTEKVLKQYKHCDNIFRTVPLPLSLRVRLHVPLSVRLSPLSISPSSRKPGQFYYELLLPRNITVIVNCQGPLIVSHALRFVSDKTSLRPKKLVLVLVLQIWCCFVKHDLVTLVVIMKVKDTATFQVGYYYSFSILCSEHHYCGDQQWRSLTEKLNPRSAFVYFRWSWS